MRSAVLLVGAVLVAVVAARKSEVRQMPGYTVPEVVTGPRPHELGLNV
jgi:hypothetical protein